MTVRLSKIILCLCLAAFAFMVTFGNITDYGSNLTFVQHVLSMDTTFPGNRLMYRAITNETLWNAAYWLIILGEGLTSLLFLIGVFHLWQACHATGMAFNKAKRFAVIGATMGFLVWFFGFMVVGGEWFAMWQSPTWNGQETAFRFYVAIIGVLIYLNQPDADLASN
jgi:predicted small integral membrane protein